ncbi:MAG: hypothetical protein JO208_12565 [Alphaproteobacteria bacterium]|nr:hypothetical protein [Alphaproteobacteria bacterium]
MSLANHILRKMPSTLQVTSLVAFAVALPAGPAFAASYSVIHNFTGTSMGDGDTPIPELVLDQSGRLYGTTEFGGQFDLGTIFRLTKPAKGSKVWTEDILRSFNSNEANRPEGGVLIGASGELYGTTQTGGTFGGGSVYRIDNGTLTTLHEFDPHNNDGYFPIAGLTFGANGLLYGTTSGGANPNDGTVFSISPQGDGVEYALLHNFGNGIDGAHPIYGRVVANGKGVLTGTTEDGGANSAGTIFQLTPPSKKNPNWTEAVRYSFDPSGGNDASHPLNGLVAGAGGVFYGCGSVGGHGQGAVYALTPLGGNNWSETIIYNFGDQAGDPVVDRCALTVNAAGSLFGTTNGGGQFGAGAFFEVDPPAGGQTSWTEKVLHSFGPFSSADGVQPESAPVRQGTHYYGVTTGGGTSGLGTVYEITP